MHSVGSAEFQFHKGTIRTLQGLFPLPPVQFNSIKVQLEPSGSALAILRCCRYFNSIKIRLELNIGTVILSRQVFQFHKGTIRTRTPCKMFREAS